MLMKCNTICLQHYYSVRDKCTCTKIIYVGIPSKLALVKCIHFECFRGEEAIYVYDVWPQVQVQGELE